jgi:hypothetical protein
VFQWNSGKLEAGNKLRDEQSVSCFAGQRSQVVRISLLGPSGKPKTATQELP